MHDFGELVYLDLHKTGSFYTSSWLREAIILNEQKFRKHVCIRGDYNQNTFYFITVRNPLSMYSSLYRYGLDKRGAVFKALNMANKTHVYKNFDDFIAFCLDGKS